MSNLVDVPAAPPQQEAPAAGAAALVVGPELRIVGSIEGASDVQVHGRIEGRIQALGTVTVEPGAWVIGEVQAREVVVLGSLRGPVRAAVGIEVGPSGRMAGDAVAPRVSIAAGAAFRGRVEMGEAAAVEEIPPPFPAPRPAAAPRPPAAPTHSLPAPAAAPRPAAAPLGRSEAVRPLSPASSPAAATARPAAVSGRPGLPPLARPAGGLRRRAD
jgi:cytoskeletal protein CcmA (bactofilin family)